MAFIPVIKYFRVERKLLCFLLFSQMTYHIVTDSVILGIGSGFFMPILFMANIRHSILGDLKIRRSPILTYADI